MYTRTMERYDIVKDIGSGNFGVAKLVRDKVSKELFAIKFIERGHKQICHRDLKLENTLLDGSTAPRVKICDFGYSKSGVLHSQPKTTVGTPAYIAPEVLSKREITMEEIKNHSWFLKNLPVDMSEGSSRSNNPSQSEEEIVWIIEEARKAITGASGLSGAGGSGDSGSGAMGSSMDLDDLDVDYDDDIDTALFFSQLVAASENKSSSGPAFLSVPEAPSFFLILFSFALFTLAQSFVEMLGVLWLTKRYLFSFRWRRSRLSMEQRRDSRRDDSEEGRRLGLKGFVRSGFSLSDLWKFFLGDRSNHVAELNNPLPTTMRWIRLVVRARHHWKREAVAKVSGPGNVSNGCLPLVSSSECGTGEVHLARLHQLVLGVLRELLCTELDVLFNVTSVSKARGPSNATIGRGLDAEVEVTGWWAMGSSGNSRSL
ncbi:hypothetical protein HID58_026838, partial [Brassica napus]